MRDASSGFDMLPYMLEISTGWRGKMPVLGYQGGVALTDNTGHTAVLFARIIVMLSLGRFLIHQIIIR